MTQADQESGLAIKIRKSLPGFTLDVDLALPGQGVTAVFGPSGCGKTTLLRCVAGLDAAEGEVIINGDVWLRGNEHRPVHHRPLAYVFQETSLFPHLTVQQNLDYGFSRVAKPERLVTMAQATEWLGIEHMLTRRPHRLSGGERQRVAIARALLTSPRLLLMDEPLSALDHASRRDILPYLERLHGELAIPVLYVTHSPDELARIADHVVMMNRGEVTAVGNLTDVTARMDLANRDNDDPGVILDAIIGYRESKWHLCRAEFEGGGLWVRDNGLPEGTTVRLRVLARDVSLASSRHDDQSILNLLPATVKEIAPGGHPSNALVRLDLNPRPLLARLTRRSVDRLELAPGRKVWVQVKSVAVLD
ncbi:molybdenum ABC transporter ATP-binding protein [Marinobacter salicampi]|uniref:molybdenum ABC transporter ATP-binding protein n=1 Tax=Marinobacter salicampi TaxID=435907 RepID=UPI001407DA7E|nr:molybdenum ABC transporter ATP-binding protein [Marinobacter salicampi]